MCCLPLPLLKLLTTIGAVISALLSLGVLVAVIYVTFQERKIIDNANQPILKTLFVIVYIVSIVFLVLALCGIYGSIKAKKKNKLAPCLLSAYSVSVAVFFVVFVIMTIVIFAAPPAVFGQSCKKGSSTTFVEKIYNLSENAYENFCTSSCPCLIQEVNMDSDLANWLRENNKTFGSNHDYYINFQQCLEPKDQNSILLGTLQNILQCGGWCQDQQPRFSRFYDINDCVTKQCYEKRPGCYNEFKNFMISKGTIMGVATTIASVIALVNMIFICCICFHPMRKTQKHKNFYSRMMETND